MNFASDNTSTVHPKVMEALIRANEGHAPSYGADALTEAAKARVREVLEAPEAEVHFIASGTGANALAISSLVPSWGKVFCHEGAHVLTSECGSIPFWTGGGTLVPVPGAAGKIDPDALAQALHESSRPDVHAGERSALTLTNSTEAGGVYAPAEVAALTAQARAAGLAVHMDGARFGNAVAALECTPADLTHRAGVDALSFGGTKNGAMMVEAVVIFDPARAPGLEMRRMRAGHLLSKHRFLAAQMLALLTDGLWLELAAHANAMAERLAAALAAVPGVTINVPRQANQIFATLPAEAHTRARKAGAVYHPWPRVQAEEGDLSVRMVCGWSTTPDEVDRLVATLRG
ncbi:aminotransferase class V-fold PLP-dependent enzyme [Paracoccus sp. S-4012]|uniref:threonine aldolase family protein n=1 Tax=Paracoccus sp. S-4012 TaxID=2665648 RepID=UPI0012B1017C|nr:aminotransferase class V-fold PLP-dependent enzyme [Paracoccus sp. S-4012]MRX51768.1 aminotransferase class V-fold PLP-dependent enzyme [Paracoccus sp. S-4012]